jgi:hypothetical protein
LDAGDLDAPLNKDVVSVSSSIIANEQCSSVRGNKYNEGMNKRQSNNFVLID